jgi:glycosyltransferase involved in cell wall biosynthesis
VPIPLYVGPAQYLLRAHQVHTEVQAAMNSRSAVVLRIPSQLGTSAAAALWRQRRPYAVHVVGDPSEAFAAGVTHHPLRSVFRWWFTRNQARQCARASAALYVTSRLRFAYPPSAAERVLDCSDVNLEDAAFRNAPRVHGLAHRRKLVTVATLSQVYKGIDVLLDAVALCHAAGTPFDLTIVGSGRYQPAMAAQARRLGIQDSVHFTGSLPAGAAVRGELDKADLFVLPSRTEGMPRALLEAMARGLPCVATRVGGVPDVLPDDDLVAPGDAPALAALMKRIAASPECLDRMSEQNLQTASEYRAEQLYPRWDRFFTDLRDRTRSYFRQYPSEALWSPIHG